MQAQDLAPLTATSTSLCRLLRTNVPKPVEWNMCKYSTRPPLDNTPITASQRQNHIIDSCAGAGTTIIWNMQWKWLSHTHLFHMCFVVVCRLALLFKQSDRFWSSRSTIFTASSSYFLHARCFAPSTFYVILYTFVYNIHV